VKLLFPVFSELSMRLDFKRGRHWNTTIEPLNFTENPLIRNILIFSHSIFTLSNLNTHLTRCSKNPFTVDVIFANWNDWVFIDFSPRGTFWPNDFPVKIMSPLVRNHYSTPIITRTFASDIWRLVHKWNCSYM